MFVLKPFQVSGNDCVKNRIGRGQLDATFEAVVAAENVALDAADLLVDFLGNLQNGLIFIGI